MEPGRPSGRPGFFRITFGRTSLDNSETRRSLHFISVRIS